jgi:transposase
LYTETLQSFCVTKKRIIHASVYVDPTEIVNHLVGLKDIVVLSYTRRGPCCEIMVEQVLEDPTCPRCGGCVWIKDRPVVDYVDLPFGGVPITLRWKKHRLVCRTASCPVRSFTSGDHRIAAVGCRLTTRAAKWVTKQIAGGQTVSHLARELGCSWDSINAAMRIYGEALLAADTKRLKETTAIGLDEALFVRQGPYKQKLWTTTVCDVANHQLIDVLPTREYPVVAGWLLSQPHHMRENLQYGCLDMSRVYRAVFNYVTPKATKVVDRFHVMRNAIKAVDETRRRVQQERLGHRGRKDDPLYKSRKLLVMTETRSNPELIERLQAMLELGDPNGEVSFAYAMKEAVAQFYDTSDRDAAQELLRDIIDHCLRKSAPPEVKTLGRTLENWFDEIVAWHEAHVSNGPTEGMNNLLKRVKRVAFGFTNFENFRIRALLYAGNPSMRVLDSIVVT